jgi:hypothetical protein
VVLKTPDNQDRVFVFLAQGPFMAQEKPESELARLREEQRQTRQDEVFGGLSLAERARYNGKAERIHVLERTIQVQDVAQKSSQSAKAKQRRQWKSESETDTPQAEAHQPYRSREKDSAHASRDTTKKRGKVKNESDEKGSE